MAQLVEQRTCNAQVGGSSPSAGSIGVAIYPIETILRTLQEQIEQVKVCAVD